MSSGSPPRLPLRRQPGWAWLRILRPIALTIAIATAVGFAFVLENGTPIWHEVLRVGLVMGAILAFASVMNDILDRHHDRDVYIWRPLPADLINRDHAVRLTQLLAILAIALAASLGWRPLIIALAGLAAAYLYNVRLKYTPFSWMPFALAFALVPVWVAESVDRFDDVLWWSFPVGLSGGLATYMAIKLPDYERDDTDHTRNFLHWLTIDYAVPVAWGAMGAFIVIAVASANIQDIRAEWLIAPAAVAITLTVGVMLPLFFGVTERKLIAQRWLLSASVVALSVGWLGSIIP
jgi:4-hydroxybenzoate polyprenyltransferase